LTFYEDYDDGASSLIYPSPPKEPMYFSATISITRRRAVTMIFKGPQQLTSGIFKWHGNTQKLLILIAERLH
jgi:hypothetical protein